MFEYRVLRIFGSKRQELVGDWRRLHKEKLQNFYSSPVTIRVIRPRSREMDRTCSMRREDEKFIVLF
jgi:hypothetical protein